MALTPLLSNFGYAKLIVVPKLHVRRVRLEKLQIIPRHSGDDVEHFCVCEIDSNAVRSAFVERHLVLASRHARGAEPPVGIECPGIQEDALVRVNAETGHAHGCARGYGLAFVLESFVRGDTADSCCHAE